jgi:hypothetical protein
MKGAIISFDIASPIPQIIMFQYNPLTLSRTLQAQSTAAEGNSNEPFRLKGPPIETISLEVELDATDQLERPDQNKTTTALGIYPQLSALEMILYPKSALVIANTILANIGTIEIVGPEGPFTLFIWGPKRVLPVRLTDFKITEEAHDVNLNPIQAKISLGLRVLSYVDLSLTHPGYTVFLAHQIIKETMAAIGSINSNISFGAEVNFSASASIGVG